MFKNDLNFGNYSHKVFFIVKDDSVCSVKLGIPYSKLKQVFSFFNVLYTSLYIFGVVYQQGFGTEYVHS